MIAVPLEPVTKGISRSPYIIFEMKKFYFFRSKPTQTKVIANNFCHLAMPYLLLLKWRHLCHIFFEDMQHGDGCHIDRRHPLLVLNSRISTEVLRAVHQSNQDEGDILI